MFSFSRAALALALIAVQQAYAQSPAPAPAPAFDVASVKPDKTGGMGVRIMFQPGGRFTADNITLKFLIRLAYDVQDFQISGGPPWINSDRYDIEAKADGPPEPDRRTMTEEQRKADMAHRRLMIQALLAERFKLTVHKESKDAPIYALVVAKNGLKIKELPPEEKPQLDATDPPEKPDLNKRPSRGGMRMGRGELTSTGIKLSFLAEALSNQVGRTVIDKTGLKGDYSFELKWTPDESQGAAIKGPGDGAPPSADANGPSIFTAIQEQLGLKLESQKGPVDLIVIDHVEKASEN